MLISIGGLVFGLVFGAALALILDFNDESVRSEQEAASLLGKAVLVSVPQVYPTKERRMRQLRILGAFLGTGASAIILAIVVSMLGLG